MLTLNRKFPGFKPRVGSLINRAHPVSNGLVLAFLGLEGAGQVLGNSAYPGIQQAASGGTVNWSPRNSVAPGPFGVAFQPSASLVVLNHTTIDSLIVQSGGHGFTALCWFINTGNVTFWQKVTTAGGSTAMWSILSNAANISLLIASTNGGNFQAITTGIPADHTNLMHCYVITYNGVDWKTLSSFQWYIDGQPATMSSGGNNPQNPIRTDVGGDFKLVTGSHSHLMLWNRALTASEVLTLFQNPFCFMMPNFEPIAVPGNVALDLTATDTLSESDTVDRLIALPRSISDSFSFSDFVARSSNPSRTATDTVSFSDSVSRLIALARAITDSESFSDSAAPNAGLSRAATDSVSFSDSVARQIALLRAITDSESFSDSATQGTGIARSAVDTESFSDSVVRAIALPRIVTDSEAFSESVTRLIALLRTASDTVSFSDVATAAIGVTVSALDTLTFSDSVTRQIAISRIVTDIESFSDSASATALVAKFVALLLQEIRDIPQATVVSLRTVLQAIALAEVLTMPQTSVLGIQTYVREILLTDVPIDIIPQAYVISLQDII